MPKPVPLLSSKPEDFRTRESDASCLPQAPRDLGETEDGPPTSLRVCLLQPLPCSVASGQSESRQFNVFSLSRLGLLCPGVVCLNFSDSPMPLVKGSTFQLSSVSQREAYLQARPGGTHQPARISPLLSHQLLPATQHLS